MSVYKYSYTYLQWKTFFVTTFISNVNAKATFIKCNLFMNKHMCEIEGFLPYLTATFEETQLLIRH